MRSPLAVTCGTQDPAVSLSLSLSLSPPTSPSLISLLLLFLPPPHPSPPFRLKSRVLTLGLVQICRLHGCEVVMRAKKNSLALSLTTRLVCRTKPNKNSILNRYSVITSYPLCVPSLSMSASLMQQQIIKMSTSTIESV